MKERVLRDGKRKKTRRPKEVRRDGTVQEVFDGMVFSSRKTRRQGEKARCLQVRLENGESFLILDPEECLHVGKHDGKYGVVYAYKEYRNGKTGPYYMTERGLLPLDEEVKDKREMQSKALQAVLEVCVGKRSFPGGVMKKLLEPGVWGSDGFWRNILSQYRNAMLKQTIVDVMTS